MQSEQFEQETFLSVFILERDLDLDLLDYYRLLELLDSESMLGAGDVEGIMINELYK